MLLAECADMAAKIANNVSIESVCGLNNGGFGLKKSLGEIETTALVIATEGLWFPKIGAT